MEQFINTESLVIELLLVASLVALAVRRIKIPYTVSLVVVGLLITYQQPFKIELTSELILALFVPPLVFEAAFHLQFRHLRENLLSILVLAVPGVVFTTLIIGVIVAWGVGVSLTTGLVFGALISATDPVAVVALFRSLGVTRKLAALVEGESLFNDGTSIVIFKLMLVAALPAVVATTDGDNHGAVAGRTFDLVASLISFGVVSVGGIGLGFGLGWLTSLLIARIDDYLIETTLTTALAFGSYLVAERLHVSGVLAVVGAGLVCGNVGPKGMSPTTRIMLFNFWEYLAFVANSLVFLLIGLDVNISQLIQQLGPILIAVLAVIVSRAIVVYTLRALINLGKRKISFASQHVLMWGGLRGAVSLALVLSLPTNFADRDLLRTMAYGVVLFTLLTQGTTMQLLLKKLGLVKQDETALHYERHHGRILALRAGRERINRLYREGMLSAGSWQNLSTKMDHQIQTEEEARQDLLRQEPQLQQEEHENARQEGLRAQKALLSELQNSGVISEVVYEELVSEINSSLENHTDIEENENESTETLKE